MEYKRCKVHVLCNDKCLPYVFLDPESKKYAIVFKDLDYKKITNNHFISKCAQEISSVPQIVFRKIDKSDYSFVSNIVNNIKMIDTDNESVAMITVQEFDRIL